MSVELIYRGRTLIENPRRAGMISRLLKVFEGVFRGGDAQASRLVQHGHLALMLFVLLLLLCLRLL
jgi:hypothetical protein